jgi:hypothetical protein
MRKALLLGGGVVVLLFAALTACSDGLSAGDDDPLADRVDYYVYGITYLMNPPDLPDPHEADVGLRHVYCDPWSTYIYTGESNEETGYYEFLLNELDTAWYATDAWFESAAGRWQGSSSDFYWNSSLPQNFIRNIYMYKQ